MKQRQVEVLAPAGSFESMKAAIAAGADAVYIGGSQFGARAYADNLDEDHMLEAINYAHLHGASLYMTVNTLVKEKELDSLFDYLNPYYMAGLDAVIVQDMGVFTYIREHFPDLDIHASTQMTITGAEGASLLKKMGASRVVTARELSLEEIARIHREVGVEIESFVHGALCYCYSGQCLLSSLIGGRSGNRGRCAQPCRLPYDVRKDGHSCQPRDERYVMSLKDLCVLDILPDILEAGVYSLKIEGRMKSPRYTAGVVSIYRKYVDRYLKSGRKGYHVDPRDKKILLDLFDRGGFTDGYYVQHNGRDMVALKEKPAFRQGNQELFEYLDAAYVNAELKETPSILMRPKAPKEGKRILLERLPFIWNRLNFIAKVTVRNLFRYKKRFFMTVFGIAGCTALLVTGFGVKDSIRTIVDTQFGEIFKYNMTMKLNKDISLSDEKALVTELQNDPRIQGVLSIHSENGKLSDDDVTKDVNVFVPHSVADLDPFVSLRNRVTQEKVELPEYGVVLSEKVGKQLGVKVGDNVTIENADGKKAEAKVAGIVENYLFHYVYLSPTYYEELFNETPTFESILGVANDDTLELEEAVSSDYMNQAGVSGISWNSSIGSNFDNMIQNLNYVVLLMIISAGALAFVVLYNLTNVNISERMREIATIKVLGFYDKEVSAYIYRENIILTLIGTVVGLGLGILLHRYIMLTVELDNMMFGRQIAPLSFIYSAGLTILFAFVVNFAMYYKLKKIEMVESLKSVD